MHTAGDKSVVGVYRYFRVSRYVAQFTIMCIVSNTSSRDAKEGGVGHNGAYFCHGVIVGGGDSIKLLVRNNSIGGSSVQSNR